MKKTNVRIRNYFVIEENNEYFLSSIKDLESWKNIDETDLKKEDDITKKLLSLMKKYDVYSNVNFFIDDEKKKINVQGGG
jgi:hypothetical protein